ncbi:MAG: hypothetical protein ABWY78_08095 [Microvirga sp.]
MLRLDAQLPDLAGFQVGHVWRGHGSAICLEFGQLHQTRKFDGSSGQPEGELSLLIEWSWRIEGRRTIVCGSWSDQRLWVRAFSLMKGKSIASFAVSGHLPELTIGFNNEARLITFMTAEGSPAWTLFDRRFDVARWYCVEKGKIIEHPGP